MWEELAIFEEDRTVEAELYDKIIQLFSGANREWTLFRPPDHFSRYFSVENGFQLLKRKQSFSGPQPAELHFSVEQFMNPGSLDRIGWTLVFDIDSGNNSEKLKSVGVKCLTKVLDKYSLFYILDSRLHVWIPEWETRKVNNWSDLYGSDFATNLHQYLFYISGLPNGVRIDSNLWKTSRHKIRAPYSPHLKTGTIQAFTNQGKNLSIDEAGKIWLGENFSVEELSNYMDAFALFVKSSNELGAQIVEATNKEIKNWTKEQGKTYDWIEGLLETSVPTGFRGLFLFLVIMPYLTNVKKVKTLSESEEITEHWLALSGGDRSADRDLYGYPRYSFYRLQRLGIHPLSIKTLATKYPELYKIVMRGVKPCQ